MQLSGKYTVFKFKKVASLQLLSGKFVNYRKLKILQNTYFVGMNERFPMRPIERENREIHYYQWVPFILVGEALLMMLPKLLWNAFNWKTGLRKILKSLFSLKVWTLVH